MLPAPELPLLRPLLHDPDDLASRARYAAELLARGDLLRAEALTTPRATPEAAQAWKTLLGTGVLEVHLYYGVPVALRVSVGRAAEGVGFDLGALLEALPVRELAPVFADPEADDEDPEDGGPAQRLAVAEVLARDPRCAGVRVLDLSFDDWGEAAWRTLLASPRLHLEGLVVGDGDCRLWIAEPLATSPALDTLRTLTFAADWRCDFGDAGLATLLAAPRWTGLHTLELYNLALTGAGAQGVARCSALRGLRVLDLGGGSYKPNRVGPEGTQALAASPFLGSLERLVLDFNAVGDAGVEALARSTTLGSLRSLSLKHNGLTDGALVALAEGAGMPALSTLELTFNQRLTHRGVAALAASPRMRALESLWIRQCPGLGAEGAHALADAPGAVGLRDLNLLECKLGPEGARALVESPHLGSLKTLQVSGNQLDDATRALLRARFGEGVGAR